MDRVVILDHGRVVADGNMSKLRQLAMLPVRLRLTLAEDAAFDWMDVEARRIGPGLFELSCLQGEKMGLLRRAAEDPQVADVEVLQPTLDELYGHFLHGRAGRAE
ncbi:ATP-binding cassette domain-containing protein [Roseicella frigidaeris]|uniref:ABC transporter ATP-binding protein n=1 Tax=Roseicella frigidaeris TaxID=2230885 RepID=A0A327LYS5_9PROT|nr:hypothetical protein [Roseicella frigidaeris]RAI55173.1 hypothetical protein DOO78_24820 [Roseicella frigidaeris]